MADSILQPERRRGRPRHTRQAELLPTDMLRPAEVARRRGQHPATVGRWIKDGRIPARVVAGCTLVSWAELSAKCGAVGQAHTPASVETEAGMGLDAGKVLALSAGQARGGDVVADSHHFGECSTQASAVVVGAFTAAEAPEAHALTGGGGGSAPRADASIHIHSATTKFSALPGSAAERCLVP